MLPIEDSDAPDMSKEPPSNRITSGIPRVVERCRSGSSTLQINAGNGAVAPYTANYALARRLRVLARGNV